MRIFKEDKELTLTGFESGSTNFPSRDLSLISIGILSIGSDTAQKIEEKKWFRKEKKSQE